MWAITSAARRRSVAGRDDLRPGRQRDPRPRPHVARRADIGRAARPAGRRRAARRAVDGRPPRGRGGRVRRSLPAPDGTAQHRHRVRRPPAVPVPRLDVRRDRAVRRDPVARPGCHDPATRRGAHGRRRDRALRPRVGESGGAAVRPPGVPGVGRPLVRQRDERTPRDDGQRRPARRQLPRRHAPAHRPRRDVRRRRRWLPAAERDRAVGLEGPHDVRGAVQELRRPAGGDRRAPARPAAAAVQGDRRPDGGGRAAVPPDDRQDGELPVRLLAAERDVHPHLQADGSRRPHRSRRRRSRRSSTSRTACSTRTSPSSSPTATRP